MKRLIAVPVLILLLPVILILLNPQAEAADPGESLQYTKLYTIAGTDTTAFEEVTNSNIEWRRVGRGILASSQLSYHCLGFFDAIPGARTNWHPIKYKRFVFVLSGELGVSVGNADGNHVTETKTFATGDILLVDTKGTNGQHKTSTVGDKNLLIAYVQLEACSHERVLQVF